MQKGFRILDVVCKNPSTGPDWPTYQRIYNFCYRCVEASWFTRFATLYEMQFVVLLKFQHFLEYWLIVSNCCICSQRWSVVMKKLLYLQADEKEVCCSHLVYSRRWCWLISVKGDFMANLGWNLIIFPKSTVCQFLFHLKLSNRINPRKRRTFWAEYSKLSSLKRLGPTLQRGKGILQLYYLYRYLFTRGPLSFSSILNPSPSLLPVIKGITDRRTRIISLSKLWTKVFRAWDNLTAWLLLCHLSTFFQYCK